MALISADRIKETTTTTGTGNVTLAGAVSGFRTFASVMANNDTCLYCIALAAEWEVGLGTFVSATPALARTTVFASSNGGALVSFSAGSKEVFITDIAERFVLPQLTAAPTAPSSGVFMWARNRAGRWFPEFEGPSGLDSSLQPALFGNNVTMWLPGTGTTAAISFGVSWTNATTQAHPTIADTSIMTSIRRATYTTTTTSGNATGVRSTAPLAIRNRGFFFFARFGILTYVSTMQIMVGLAAASGILGGDPSAVNDMIAMTKDTGETTWQVTTRDTSTASKTSTGRTTAAAGNAEIFDFTAFCKPAASKITVRVVDIGTQTVLVNNVEKSSNLPTNATALYAHAEARTAAASLVAIFLNRIYVETDL